jgi:hypothetical protein
MPAPIRPRGTASRRCADRGPPDPFSAGLVTEAHERIAEESHEPLAMDVLQVLGATDGTSPTECVAN